jgi:hypothetical protein
LLHSTYDSPLRLFLPIAFAHFVLSPGFYLYTFTVDYRFFSIAIFLIGLVSEPITQLMNKQ